MSRVTTPLFALLLAFAVAGCSPVPRTAGDPLTPSSTPTDPAETPEPALTRGTDGSAQAVGTVAYRRDQGGFFAVVDIAPGDLPSTDAHLIAILVGPDGERSAPDLRPLVGAYCSFSGDLRDDVASSTPVPELVFGSYRILEPVPSP